MKQLKPITLYVEVPYSNESKRYVVYGNEEGTECKVEKKTDQYIFTKEELIELLRETWEDGILTFISNVDKETAKTQFINNLLNQQ